MIGIACRILIFVLILVSASLRAQEQDVVYLKNGSILYGKLLEVIPGDKVRLEIIGNNQLVFTFNEIEKISKAEPTSKKNSEAFNNIRLSGNIHFFGGSNNSAGFSITPHYHFPCRISTGIGTGLEIFDYQVMPVFADISYQVFKGNFSPYLYARSGYTFPLSKAQSDYYSHPEYKGGILAGAGIGLRKEFRNKNALLFSVGYRYQKLRTITTYDYWYDGQTQTDERIDHLNRINISLGLQFN
jgi:hypothetical protein